MEQAGRILRAQYKRLLTEDSEEQDDYQRIFTAVMDKFGINSPDEIQDNTDKEKKFYSLVDAAYAKYEEGESVESVVDWVKDVEGYTSQNESKKKKSLKESNMKGKKRKGKKKFTISESNLRKYIRKIIEAVLDGDDTRAGAKRFGPAHKRSKSQKRGAGFEPSDEDEVVVDDPVDDEELEEAVNKVYKRVLRKLSKKK